MKLIEVKTEEEAIVMTMAIVSGIAIVVEAEVLAMEVAVASKFVVANVVLAAIALADANVVVM